jgi:selenocysteine lyase/cysteine desulfurase
LISTVGSRDPRVQYDGTVPDVAAIVDIAHRNCANVLVDAVAYVPHCF